MDQHYKELYKEVQKLRHKLHDLLDDHGHRLAQTLKKEVQKLEDEMEVGKKPRSLEDRVKSIQGYLKQAEHGGVNGIMNTEHAYYLHDAYGDVRSALKRMPNY